MDIFLATLFIVVVILLIIVVLLQKGRGGGLGAAFGGAGSSAFGTRTGDVFTWVTIVLTALFLLLAVTISMVMNPPRLPAAKPQFMPAPQPIERTTYVTISCATEDANIRYTTDGTEPTELTGYFYEANPVEVEPGTTLRARAFATGNDPSEIMAGHYPRRGETTQPATSATAPAE